MSDKSEVNEADIFNRNHVLSQIDDLLKIQDETERVKKTASFIEARLSLLTSVTIPREFSIMTAPRKGFLHPEAGIRRNFIVDPFHVDDPNVYKLLLDTFQEYKSHPGWQSKTLREIAPHAVLRTINLYYKNFWSTSDTDQKNRDFYLSRSGCDSEDIHLEELKGKGIAVCAEKAALAQNLLSFLGYESEVVASTSCQLNPREKNDQTGHMYNIVTSGENHLLFDPTNPVIINDKEGYVNDILPAFYPLSQEEYMTLIRGGQVKAIHNDGVRGDQNYIKGPDQERIYGGPNKATLY